jgi:hypothetical protein
LSRSANLSLKCSEVVQRQSQGCKRFNAPDKRQQPLQSSGKHPSKAKTDKTSKVVGTADTTPKGVIEQSAFSESHSSPSEQTNQVDSIDNNERNCPSSLCVDRLLISKTSRDSLKNRVLLVIPYWIASVNRFCVLHGQSSHLAFQKFTDFRANVLSYSDRFHDLPSSRYHRRKG